jgi:hypothetical protein
MDEHGTVGELLDAPFSARSVSNQESRRLDLAITSCYIREYNYANLRVQRLRSLDLFLIYAHNDNIDANSI